MCSVPAQSKEPMAMTAPTRNCSSAAFNRAESHLKLGQSGCCQFQGMSDSGPYLSRTLWVICERYKWALSLRGRGSSRRSEFEVDEVVRRLSVHQIQLVVAASRSLVRAL